MKRFIAVFAVLCLFMGNVSALAASKHRKPTFKAKVSAQREVTEKALPRLAVDPDGIVIPDVRAAAAIVYNPNTEEILWAKDADAPRSIASITKVMTAEVTLENPDVLNETVTVTAKDTFNANHTFLRPNDRLTGLDLLRLMLIASDNAAARVLARVSPFGYTGFIERMNERANELGLSNTAYADPAGLLAGNVSTAFDMARLIVHAGDDPLVTSIMQIAEGVVNTGKRRIVFHTTDHLLTHKGIDVRAAKTGFTNPAGFCLASLIRTGMDEQVAIVVLGARSNVDRFVEVENLYKWTMLRSVAVVTASTQRLSEQGAMFLKAVEGFKPSPFLDSNRQWAVGYGFHTWDGRRVTRHYPRVISQDDADAQFAAQMAHYEAMVPDVPTQGGFDALVSVAYNLGHINDSIIEKLNAKLPVTTGDFLTTATVRGRPYAGLVNRRLREFALFASVYEDVRVSLQAVSTP